MPATRSIWAGMCFLLLTASLVNAQEPGPAREAVVRHMHEHVNSVNDIRTAIIAGRLAGVREPANWLANHETVDGLPGNWRAFVTAFREQAVRVERAQSLVAAAMATSNLALTCAGCHAANDVKIEFERVEKPPNDLDDIATHMQRHRWAADRMWEGLYGPSERSWNEGVDMLLDVPLQPAEIKGTHGASHGELGPMAREVHLLGSRGIGAHLPEQRVQIYSHYLSLCASCHTMLGRGPDK